MYNVHFYSLLYRPVLWRNSWIFFILLKERHEKVFLLPDLSHTKSDCIQNTMLQSAYDLLRKRNKYSDRGWKYILKLCGKRWELLLGERDAQGTDKSGWPPRPDISTQQFRGSVGRSVGPLARWFILRRCFNYMDYPFHTLNAQLCEFG
jgi:hypothetical protein